MAKIYHVDLTTEERINLEKIVNKLKSTSESTTAHRKYNLYSVYEPQRARAIIDKLEFVFTSKHGS